MFKQRAARELIRKAVTAIEAGAFFSRPQADRHSHNEYARGYIYTEAMFHQFYALTTLFEETFGKRHWWASPDFLWQEITRALEKDGSKIGALAANRCDEFAALAPAEDAPFQDSSRRVAEIDPGVDQARLVQAISGAVNAFTRVYRPELQAAALRRLRPFF